MNSTIKAKILAEINANLKHACGKVTKVGELPALAGWVNQNFLDQLQKSIAQGLVAGNQIHLKLGWIDKSPIAYPTEGATENMGGEIADVALIRLFSNKKMNKVLRGRMLLIQAKTADKSPYDPFLDNSVNTIKECELMANWPEFNLSQWSASSEVTGPYRVLDDLDPSDKASTILSMNWFAVTAHDPKAKSAWAKPSLSDSPWWTTPPDKGGELDIPLANVLLEFILQDSIKMQRDGKDVSVNVGREFAIRSSWPTDYSWSDLAHQIAAWAAASMLPPSLFGPGAPRLMQFDMAFTNALLSTGLQNPDYLAGHQSLLNYFDQAANHEIGLVPEERPKKMPVIFVIHEE